MYYYDIGSFSLEPLVEALQDFEFQKVNVMRRLFQYAVILHEYEDVQGITTGSTRNYKDSKIIIEPKIVLAKSEKDLVFKVTREIPEEYAVNPDNVEIIIRPF